LEQKPGLTIAIRDYIASRGAEGASRREICQALSVAVPNLNLCLMRRLLPRGLVFQSGPNKHYRFFVDKAHAQEYSDSIPEVLAVKRAAAKERQRIRQLDYMKRITISKGLRAAEIIKKAGDRGMSRKEVDAALGVKDCSDAISSAVRTGIIFAGGPLQFRRYFGCDEWAAIWDIDGKHLRDTQVAQKAKERNARNMPAKLAREAAKRAERRKERQQSNQDTGRRKNAFVITKGRDAPVKIKLTAKQITEAQVVIPPHVKVEVCQPWTHDVRFQLPPGERVVGGFLTEWRNRRAA
jgi:hypothetical protein